MTIYQDIWHCVIVALYQNITMFAWGFWHSKIDSTNGTSLGRDHLFVWPIGDKGLFGNPGWKQSLFFALSLDWQLHNYHFDISKRL